MPATPLIPQERALASSNSRLFLAGCAFLAGLLCAFNIPIVGSFPAAEMILGTVTATGLFTVLVNQRAPRSLLASPWLWAFLAAQFLTLSGYAIADFYRTSAPADIARGWSRIAFLSIDTIAMALLFGEDIRNFRLLLTGAAISGVIALQLSGAQYGDAWKFGYAWPVTMMAVVWGAELGIWITIGALLVLGGVHYVADFRSLCGMCLVVAALLLIQAFERRQRKLIFIVITVIGCAGLLALKSAPSSMDTSERGARSNVERSSMLTVAWQAFAENPWIGQGSWFSNSDVMSKFLDLRAAAADEAGVHGYSAEESDEKIAIHSQLLVSLAEGGMLGGAFFVFYGAGVLWALGYCVFIRPADRWSAAYCLILISALWNLLMSPFSGSHRINIAVAISVLLLILRERKQPDRPELIDETDAESLSARLPGFHPNLP